MSRIDGRLDGRVCVITGTASGIGRAAALRFAGEGATIVGVDIDPADGAATGAMVEEAGGRHHFVEADVADPVAVRRLAAFCRRELGQVDALFNNAAVVIRDTVTDFDLDAWDRVMAVNVKGPLLCASALADGLAASGRGSVINHSSIDGVYANAHVASYSVSKAALNGLTRVMATTLAQRGIRTNAICTGGAQRSEGAIGSRTAAEMNTDPAWIALTRTVAAATPGGRVGSFEEVAAVAAFLASDDSSFVNGTSILVDGGRGALTPGTGEPTPDHLSTH